MDIGDEIKSKKDYVNQNYALDQRELGKILIIVSFTLLVVSAHAVYTIDDAVEQASNSTERMEGVSIMVNSDRFQSSMESLDNTGMTIGGRTMSEVVEELQYMTDTVDEVDQLSQDLEEAQRTYQWTVLIGILGMVAGITVIYI